MSTPAQTTAPPPPVPARRAAGALQQQPNGATPQQRQPASTRTTASRVLALSVASVLVSVLVAVLGFVAAQNQAAGMARASTTTERVLNVMAVRNALLVADGAATNAFLVGGLEPQNRRAVYDEAIAEAGRLLAALAAGADDEDAGLIAELTNDLTSYTALVEAARVNNRQGFPVGAAYLDQASTLVRDEMLVDLDSVLQIAADDAAADLGTTNRSIAVIAVLVLALVVLVVCQVQLARISKRRFNGGLVLTTLALLIAFVVGGFASLRAASSADDVRTDTYRPTLAVAQASVLAAEARTLESFTLIKRGSGQSYEEAFVERTTEADARLAEVDPNLQQLLAGWVAQHQEIRALDDGGDWDAAVALAITDDDGGPSAAYETFSSAAQDAVSEGSAEVTGTLSDAAGQARLAAWALAIAGALGAVAAWRGTAPRREEYR